MKRVTLGLGTFNTAIPLVDVGVVEIVPTLFFMVHPPDDTESLREEQYGPALTYRSVDEDVERANPTHYGVRVDQHTCALRGGSTVRKTQGVRPQALTVHRTRVLHGMRMIRLRRNFVLDSYRIIV